jgi:hypothetical protein
MSKLLWIILAGLAFAIAGWVCSLWFLSNAIGDWRVMLYAAPAAAFLGGAFFWWLLVMRPERPRWVRGMIAGALTGLAAHPLAWYLAILVFYVAGVRDSLGQETLDPLTGLWASLVYSLLSWVGLGWLTVPIGALVGGVMAFLQSRVFPT